MLLDREILLPGKSFAKYALSLALPIFAQNFLTYVLGMMDVILLQGLGDVAVASVSLANQAFMCLNLLIWGISSGSSVLMSQFRGAKDYVSMRKVVIISFAVATFALTVLSSVITIFPTTFLGLMTSEKELIAAGAPYVKIVTLSFICSGISYVFSSALRCCGRTKAPLAASIVSLSLNTMLNYILIYGKLSFPAMGIEGAAIATVISRIVEMIMVICFVYFGRADEIKVAPKDFNGLNGAHIKKFFVISSPIILNEFCWGFFNTVYAAIYGRMGTVTVAAMSVANLISQAFSTIPNSIGFVTAIILGHLLGSEKFEEAKKRSLTLEFYSVFLGIVMGAVMIILAPLFTSRLFGGLSREAIKLSISLICVFGCYLPAMTYNFTSIAGTLRSGGDTIAATLIDTLSMLFIGVPAGIFFGIYLKMNPVIVVALMHSESLVKAVVAFFRARTDKWVKKIHAAS